MFLQVRGLTKQNSNGSFSSNQTHRDTPSSGAAKTHDTSTSHSLQSSARKRQVPHTASDHPIPSASAMSAVATPVPKKPRRLPSPPPREDEEYKAIHQPNPASTKTEHADQSLEVDPEHKEFRAYDESSSFNDGPLDEDVGKDQDFNPGERTSGDGRGGGGASGVGHNKDDKGDYQFGGKPMKKKYIGVFLKVLNTHELVWCPLVWC